MYNLKRKISIKLKLPSKNNCIGGKSKKSIGNYPTFVHLFILVFVPTNRVVNVFIFF